MQPEPTAQERAEALHDREPVVLVDEIAEYAEMPPSWTPDQQRAVRKALDDVYAWAKGTRRGELQ